jgi:hypothetical protein
MSTAYYPLGMRTSMPSSGYNHKSTNYNKQYVTWKGTGINSNPVGTAPGHIRPLTNNDSGNIFQTGFGLPRPIKHFRKGRVIPPASIDDTNSENNEVKLINYNINRFVKSSKGTSLGGGFGGSGLLNDMQDKPGAYISKLNSIDEINGVNQMDNNCKTCEGVGIVVNYYPNKNYLTENPEPNVENNVLCCNEEYKAKRRAIYASTNLSKKYYTTTKQYLQNRCKTYDQKAFNFLSYRTNDHNEFNGEYNNPYYVSYNNNYKPGSPLAFSNMYLANCQPNAEIYGATENNLISQMLDIMFNQELLSENDIQRILELNINSIQGFFEWLNNLPSPQNSETIQIFTKFISNPSVAMTLSNPTGCQLTVYKPNNYQYAKQGAVDSSTRNLKLNVDTISSNAASIQNYNNTGADLVSANQLYSGLDNNYTNLLKNKSPGCNTPTIFPYQNKKMCYFKNKIPEYNIPSSKPGSYRYYPGTVFNSNHFSQSPNTYNTPSSKK